MSISPACQQRLAQELRVLKKEPTENITALPHPNNILEWHYCVTFPPEAKSDFAGGVYHGKLYFPPEYPFKPPGIVMITPNGRFATNTRLCLSISDYHPESWNPAWNVGTILIGLQSFMTDTEMTSGAIKTSADERKRFAAESLAFNIKNPTFRKMFPEFVEKYKKIQKNQTNSNIVATTGMTTLPGPPPQQQQQQQQGPRQLHGRWLTHRLAAMVGAVSMAVAAIGIAAIVARIGSSSPNSEGYFT